MIDFQNKKVFKLSKGKEKSIPKEVFDLLVSGEEVAGYNKRRKYYGITRRK